MGPVDAAPLHLVVAGDGAAVGLDCDHLDRALASHLAYGLGMRLHHEIEWRVLGRPGATLSQLRTRFDDESDRPVDVLVVVAGLADVLAVTPVSTWQGAARGMVAEAGRRGAGVVAFAGMPAPELLPGLAWPLSRLAGQRGRQLDAALLGLTRPARDAGLPSVVRPRPPRTLGASPARAGALFPTESGHARWAAELSTVVGAAWQRHRALEPVGEKPGVARRRG